MAVSHVKSNAIADWTGTVTIFNSQGLSVTTVATNLVRPADWNSAHNLFYTLTGNTNGVSTLSGTNIVFQGEGAVTLRGSNSSIGISISTADTTASFFFPYSARMMGTVAPISTGRPNQPLFVPLVMPNVQFQSAGVLFKMSNSTNSTGSITLSMFLAYYTRNGDTLSMLESTSTTRGITFSGSVNNSTMNATRLLPVAWTKTITAGNYWWGFLYRSTTAGAGGANASLIDIAVSGGTSGTYSGLFGVANNSTAQMFIGQGRYSTTSNALPGSVAFTEIIGSDTNFCRPFVFVLLSQSV